MVNAYIVSPKDLTLRTDNVPTLNPLAFSASQINKTTGLPLGITAVKGKVCVGSIDELPVFVRYSDGRADILDKPDGESVAYGDFVVTGTAIVVAEGQPRVPPHREYLRPLDSVRRVVIGLLADGNVLVILCTATLYKLQAMLCAYDVVTALLLASEDAYFSNPRSGISLGEQPMVSLQATYYEEIPTPIVVIDPAHGGTDYGHFTSTLREKDLTLTIAKEMQTYLRENYYGTFFLTRTDDSLVPLMRKIGFVDNIQADFVYTCHINVLDGATRGFECQCSSDTSDSTKALVTSLHSRLAQLFERQGITDNGLHYKSIKTIERYHCPSFTAKTLYIDNAEDFNILSKPLMLRMLAVAQAEALAQALELNKRIRTTKRTSCIDDKRYRVNVGEFPFKLGALELCDKLRQQGFDAYITRE